MDELLDSVREECSERQRAKDISFMMRWALICTSNQPNYIQAFNNSLNQLYSESGI